jgi:hypothetical protein
VKVRPSRIAIWVSLLLAGACAAKRLPPGTPPPEYEQRPLVPWDENPAAPAPEPTTVEPVLQAETPDAGVAPPPDGAVAAPDAGPGVFPEGSRE